MILPSSPMRLAFDLLDRSSCAVRVAAVIADKDGIFSWGWNSSGRDGLGEHAEAAAIRRANRKRLKGAILYVVAQRARSKRILLARPCPDCERLVRKAGILRTHYSFGKVV